VSNTIANYHKMSDTEVAAALKYSHCSDHSPKGQCADCKWAQEKEDRYDQVRCCCDESPNAWGDVESTDSCSSFLS
jgi:hypothetical protein